MSTPSTDSFQAVSAIHTNPPRLQHSPSLPNIWIPPHSNPTRSDNDINQRNLCRPATPTNLQPKKPVESTPTASETVLPGSKLAENQGNVTQSYNHQISPPTITNAHLHPTRRRSWKGRHPAQPLLTPPLTPSSSIRTTTSIDSSGNHGVKEHNELEALDATKEAQKNCEESTRFILLSNVSRKISADVFKLAILDTLTQTQDDPNNLRGPQPSDTDLIKGIFIRCQKTHGIMLLAFYDVRKASVALERLSIRTSSPLAECVGEEEPEEDGKSAWFRCRFVSGEELIQTIGNSQFLASSDGSFYICILPTDNATLDLSICLNEGGQHIEPEEVSAFGSERQHALLKHLLESYGDVRSFLITSHVPENDQVSAKAFFVEYFDTRDADIAYSSLDGKTLFGVKIRVYGRNIFSKDTSVDESYLGKSAVPFPHVTPASDDLSIERAGGHSKVRERFMLTDGTGRIRPRSVSAGNAAVGYSSPSLYPPPTTDAPTPSPTFFYTSYSNDSQNPDISLAQLGIDERGIKNQAVNEIRNPLLQSHNYPSELDQTRRLDNQDAGLSDGNEVQNATWRDVMPQCYTPHHECSYCPSRGRLPGAIHPMLFKVCPTPPLPSVYYPVAHPSPPLPPTLPVTTPYLPGQFGYDYETPHGLPVNGGLPGWTFDHNNAVAAGPSMVPISGNTPWLSDSQNISFTNGTHFTQHLSETRRIPFYPTLSDIPIPHPHPQNIFVANSRPASAAGNPSSVLQSQTSPASLSASAPERNQLNLARIEDGQDTRTTVMIRNIPNKMNDKDLVAYISKVCPRRFDFLYLRMDFQNGCNVGYAFVNFIHVQDLLRFAKKKLGEKWNMFSSEKVLQMSYANYQGKEALVEKFKNSCVMDERESWRPRIFYSSGPEQGLPEPFPTPTHLRRKERSSINRGALFVPGVANGAGSYNLFQNSARRQQGRHESQRNQISRYPERQHRQRTPTLDANSPAQRPNGSNDPTRSSAARDD